MLESIRNRSKGPVAKVIIGLIIVPFAFTGVYSYFNSGSANVVAVVNDSEITLREFELAYRSQQQNWGENFDRFFNTDERIQQFRMNVLQTLINQRLSTQAISDMGLRGSDEEIKQQIMSNPQFQDENGNFDINLYQVIIQSSGFSVEQYQSGLKSDIASNQFFNSLANSNFSLDYELLRHQALELQTRDIEYVVIEKSAFDETYDFSSDEAQGEVREYYDLNQQRFRIPEKVAVDYIVISKSDFMDNAIPEEEILAYYEDNQDNFTGTDRRRVAHILVNVPADADQDVIDQARSKIEQAQQALSAGDAFEDVVNTYSDDTVSAEMGGEFGWIELGMGLDEAFETAALELNEIGSLSDIVRSEFGFHILKLLESESSSATPLEEVRAEIVEFLQEDVADGRFFEARELLAERAFEYSDTLAEAATALSVEVKTSPMFDRQFGIGLPAEFQANPNVLETAFSDEILLDNVNSDVIDLDDETSVVLRKSDYQAEGVRALAEVTAEIEQLITDQRVSEKVAQTSADILNSLKAGESLDAINANLTEKGISLTWNTQAGLSRTGTEVDSRVREEAFTMSLEQNPVSQVAMTSGDYAIVRLSAVNDVSPDINAALAHQDKFINFYQQSELSSYIQHLDAKADIERRLSNTEIIQ